jgi:predicted nucleic acid-binding Zn ribbon protein
MICKICGKEFTPAKGNETQAKYCSYECREIVKKEHARKTNEKNKAKTAARNHTKRCPVCNQDFQSTHNEKYCSDPCRKKANRMRKYTTWTPTTKPKKQKKIKGLDDLMENLKAEGKTPYDYHEWKIAQAMKHVEPIRREL